MNALTLVIKRWLKLPSGWLFLLLCTAATIAFSFQLYQEAHPLLTFSIALVDQDQTPDSAGFISRLDGHELMIVHLTNSKEANQMFQRGQTVATLVIPKDCFQDLNKKQLQLTYRAYDGAAPALTDIIAQGLMPNIGKTRLTKATARYLSQDWIPTAQTHFETYLKEHPTTFTANIQAISSLKGLTGEVQQNLVTTANQALGYGLLLILLLLTRQQAQLSAQITATDLRLTTIPGQYTAMRMAQSFWDTLLAALPWTLLLLSASYFIHLKPALTTLLWLFGLVIIILYRWLIATVYRLFIITSTRRISEHNYLVELVVISLIAAPAVMGGALFPVDWLPSHLKAWMQWNPFYAYNHLFYLVVDSGGGLGLLPLYLLSLVGIGLGKFILLLSKNGIRILR